MKPFDRHQTAGQAEYERTVLRTPEWAACREAVLERDGHKCRFCGCQDELQVHHIDYADVFNPNRCVTLCRTCHAHVTEAVNRAKEPIDVKVRVWPRHNSSNLMQIAMTKALSGIIQNSLFDIWVSTLDRDGACIQMRSHNVMKPIAYIIEQSIRRQAGLDPKDSPEFVLKVQDRINHYLWKGYAHYVREGFSDSEIERFFKLAPGKIGKVREMARLYGGEDSG